MKNEYGHVNVSTKDADNPKLLPWVNNQRYEYINYKTVGKKQKSNGICEQKINQLENKGFTWVSESASKQQLCNEMFEELKLFKQKHGHADVSKKYSDNSKLG